MNIIAKLRKLTACLVLLLTTLHQPCYALIIGAADVDKPTGIPTTYDNYGLHTNILSNWDVTCWQAVSASMLSYRGYGTTENIYDWFHNTYGNVRASLTAWRNNINTYISSHISAQGQFYASIVSDPTVDWAKNLIVESPIGLIVDVSGYLVGTHAISYGGYDDTNDWSWIADPDADWRDTGLSVPASYFNWSLFDDLSPTVDYSWRLSRNWNDGTNLTYNVFGAVLLLSGTIPEPGTLPLLLISISVLLIFNFRKLTNIQASRCNSGIC